MRIKYKDSLLFLSISIFFIGILILPSISISGPPIEEIKTYVNTFYQSAMATTPHIKAVELKELIEKADVDVLVDVRTKEEYDGAHIKKALHLDRGLLEWYAPMMIKDSDARIYVYCKSGARSALATKRLLEMGYTNVTNVVDGFMGWVQAGHTVFNRHGEFVLAPQGFEKRE